jgi:hypothetical protein
VLRRNLKVMDASAIALARDNDAADHRLLAQRAGRIRRGAPGRGPFTRWRTRSHRRRGPQKPREKGEKRMSEEAFELDLDDIEKRMDGA